MSTATLTELETELIAADEAVRVMDARKAEAAAQREAAKPANRSAAVKRAAELREQIEQARASAVSAFAVAVDRCAETIAAVDSAQLAYSDACQAAFVARRAMYAAHEAVQAPAREAAERYNASATPENLAAMKHARQVAAEAVAGLPPFPQSLDQRAASRVPGVATEYRERARRMRLPV